MKKINSYLTAPVNKLIKAVGAKVLLYSELENHEKKPWYFDEYLCSTYGFHDSTSDIIGINDTNSIDGCDPIDMDSTVLHELIHFTGTKERLGRGWVVNNSLDSEDSNSKIATEAETHTEEATAQIGALKLALVLGLNPARFADLTERYVSNLSKADLDKADKDSDKAVEYLVKFIGMEKVA